MWAPMMTLDVIKEKKSLKVSRSPSIRKFFKTAAATGEYCLISSNTGIGITSNKFKAMEENENASVIGLNDFLKMVKEMKAPERCFERFLLTMETP